MGIRRILALILNILLILTSISLEVVSATVPNIELVLDKINADIGEVITLVINAKDIDNLSGYQINLKYDPEILIPMDLETKEAFTSISVLKGGNLIANDKFWPLLKAQHDLEGGILNFTGVYGNLSGYVESGKPECKGILGEIGFKVIKKETTVIRLEDTNKMPGAIKGTLLYDWFGNKIGNYDVFQTDSVNGIFDTTPTCTPTHTPTPAPTSIQNKTLKLNIASVEGRPGDTVEVPIELLSVPESGINNCDFKLSFDSKVLTLEEIFAGSITRNPEVNFKSYIKNESEYFGLVYVDETSRGLYQITQDGTFAYVRIKIKENAPAGPSVIKLAGKPAFADYRLKRIPVEISEGSVIVKSANEPAPTATKTPVSSPLPVTAPVTSVTDTPKLTATPTKKPGVTPTAVATKNPANTPTLKPIQTEKSKPSVTPTPTPTRIPTSTPTSTPRTAITPVSTHTGKPVNTPLKTELPTSTPRQPNRVVVIPVVIPTPTPAMVVEPTPADIPGIDTLHIAYINGYPDGAFRPEKNITRAEAAAIFAKLLSDYEKNDQQLQNTKYKDVPDKHWAIESIGTATNRGLFKGYPDGVFMPNKNITRAEFAAVVTNYIGSGHNQDSGIQFNDIEGHWAKECIQMLAGLNYIKGYNDGSFKPDNGIKRSECVALINRTLNRGPLYNAKQIFSDIPDVYWAFGDIAEASIEHYYKTDDSGRETFVSQ